MARIALNQLSIRELPNGSFQLFGYWHGKRVRARSENVTELEAKKAEMEASDAPDAAAVRPAVDALKYRQTWLTEAQVRDAEAAVLLAEGRTLTECVTAARRVLTRTEPVEITTALAAWKEWLEANHRFERTVEKNELRIGDFAEHSKAKHVQDITSEMCEAWVVRKGRAVNTQVTDGQVLRAFLNFCVRKRWIGVSPFRVDLKDLASVAGHVEAPKILTPDQAAALLTAAATMYDGSLLPYTILSTWCFMRSAEVTRVTPEDLKLTLAKPIVTIRPRKRGTVSYRNVDVPKQFVATLKKVKGPVFFNRFRWDRIRAAAGLVTLGEIENGRRLHGSSVWQENILRHTGISYLYQKTGDIKEVCRQAGNSDDTAFRHYLDLPAPGAEKKFWRAAISSRPQPSLPSSE
jgi:hypothetical protein